MLCAERPASPAMAGRLSAHRRSDLSGETTILICETRKSRVLRTRLPRHRSTTGVTGAGHTPSLAWRTFQFAQTHRTPVIH